jgi:hypothetical protein
MRRAPSASVCAPRYEPTGIFSLSRHADATATGADSALRFVMERISSDESATLTNGRGE